MADDARAPCACRRLEIIGSAYAVWRWSRRGTEVRLYGETHKQLRDESRLELFFRMGAALIISLGAGTSLNTVNKTVYRQ